MKKPKHKELTVALIICIVLVGASVYANVVTQHPASFSGFLGGGSSISRENFATATQEESADQRIKDIKQWINAELTKGKFKEVVRGIEALTEEQGGYVYSEDLTYADEVWNGELVSRIPQDNTTDFIFNMEDLIAKNGKVISITTSIRDITGTIGTSEQKPHATIRVTLTEISGKIIIGLPIIEGITPFLSTFFTWVVSGIIIGLPAYFTVLGIVLLIDRALLPILNKLFKKGLNKNKEALPSPV